MSKQDYYTTLGINKESSLQEIKKAYRKLAHEYHPDRNSDPSAEAKFKEVSEAYETLSDPQQKEQYDVYGHNRPQRQQQHHDPFDIFNSFFGGNRRRKGKDVKIELKITLEEALSGVNKTVTYSRNVLCGTCKGAGGTGSSCKQCGGYGQVEQQNGFMRIVTACPMCQGKGVSITKKCPDCRKGHIEDKKKFTLQIPAGIESGNRIQSRGGGDISDPSISPGDLLCVVSIKPHKLFVRQGQDLQYIQEISFVEACLGKSVKIPLLGGGEADLEMPAGTQFGHAFCLKGHGFPKVSRHHRGDLYVKTQINVPKKLSKSAKDLLKKFEKNTKD